MNLSSVQKVEEETLVFGTQPRQPYKLAGSCQPGGHLCNSNLPSQSFYPYSSCYSYMHMDYSSDWEISKAVIIHELEEVKARAAQMEKTMRWWSDCTANWREKWSKVRSERNKALEEARQLRITLDTVVKELSMLKKINKELVNEKENLEHVTAWKTEFSCSEISCIKKDLNHLTFLEREPVKELNKTNKIPVAEGTKKDLEEIKDQTNHNKKITVKNPDSFPNGVHSICSEEPEKSLDNTAKTTKNDLIHFSALHLHLTEMQKILQKEREMNMFLEKEIEMRENELFLWKLKYEELRETKLERLKQPPQLERLQFENTSEWGKREKQNLEEENRRLKLHVKEIQEFLEMKNKATLTTSNCDHQNVQSKPLVKDKNKETEESKHRIWDQTKFLVCCWRFYQDSE
ncbi:coiled-coil domain-containing protein 102B [Cuculus canorus]|uniref:coiled-coil domain-containing protein 102B n=1 Tax=Cuculus canorus TaxID=55661 RepID=UPI0023AB2C1C|nr:coiled-coil domain-containing protein 102B [Cuculus canorus]XP_053915007.1 coiled-coil domain-containing protein 102B [Cuculus canorus]